MKALLSTLCIIAVLAAWPMGRARAQVVIDYKKLALMLTQSRNANYRVYLGDSRGAAQETLGTPSSIIKQYWEISNKYVSVLSYGRNKLYFRDDKLVHYDLYDGTFSVGEDRIKSFKVGDVMGTAAAGRQRLLPGEEKLPLVPTPRDYFYGYDITKKPGRSRNLNYQIISANFLKNPAGQRFEGYFEVLFDANKRITNIALRED